MRAQIASLLVLTCLTLAAAQTDDPPPAADDLDGWWTEADRLEQGADRSLPQFAEAQKLLDQAAATPDRQDAKALLRRACKLLGQVQPDGDHPPGAAPPPPPEPDRPTGEPRQPRDPDQRRPLRDLRRGDQARPRRDLLPGRDRLDRLLQGLDPAQAQQLRALRDEATPTERERLRRLVELYRRHPDRARVELQDLLLGHRIQTLARELREEPPPETDEPDTSRRTELRQLVAELFDLRMQKQRQEISAKEAELADLQRLLQEERQILSDRQDAREELIDERVDSLLSHPRAKDW
jgi:hypothetical protein